MENNIATNTQVGLIIIPYKVYEGENAYNNDKYSRGGEFIENMVTDNHIEFCKRWFHLAGFKEIMEDMDEFNKLYRSTYTSKRFYCDIYQEDDKYYKNPFYDSGDVKKVKPLMFNEPVKSIFFYNKREVKS